MHNTFDRAAALEAYRNARETLNAAQEAFEIARDIYYSAGRPAARPAPAK